MRNAVQLMKHNPITVLSIIVAIASFGVIVTFVMMNDKIEKQLDERAKTYRQVQSLAQYEIEFYGPELRREQVTPNPKIVEQVKALNGRYGKEFAMLQKQIPLQNASGHMVLSPDVLPEWSQSSAVYDFIDQYKQGLALMLTDQPQQNSEYQLPRLQAAPPRPMEEVAEEISNIEAATFGAADRSQAASRNQLTAAQQADAQKARDEAMKAQLTDLLSNQAMKVKLYAETDPEMPGFPLVIQPWANATELPQKWQVFEGQLEFWIQQDLMAALQLANQPYDNVLSAPVKRLISVELERGYVGFQTTGLVSQTPIVAPSDGDAGRSGSSGSNSLAQIATSGPNMVASNSSRSSSANATPPANSVAGFKSDVLGALSENFGAAPSGRTSNPLYVVRHAKLHLVLDGQRGLSELNKALTSVNRMSVVGLTVKDVDEYQHLLEGYVYGETDAIEVQVVVETIWFTDWMRPFMPARVEHYLGLQEHEEFDSEGNQNMMMPDEFMSPYGDFPI